MPTPAPWSRPSWAAAHLEDPEVRLIESNEDPLVYPSGHLPGALEVDWTRDLNDPLRRDYLGRDGFETLCSRLGIEPSTTVVFYGDKNNWWATYAYWVFQLFGHSSAKILDGGRLKWQQEGRPLVREVQGLPGHRLRRRRRATTAGSAPSATRCSSHLEDGGPMIDVRSPEEFRGERMHMPDYPNEGALRGGHIPGAHNVPWARAVDTSDGTFKNADELRAIYQGEKGLDPQNDVVVYCRIGERSSHTWFVL